MITDHMALKWLKNIESSLGRIARGAFGPPEYDYVISYRKSKLNMVADAFFRQPMKKKNYKKRNATAGGEEECI